MLKGREFDDLLKAAEDYQQHGAQPVYPDMAAEMLANAAIDLIVDLLRLIAKSEAKKD